jgi:type IV secretion system protein VirD4
MNEKQSKAIGPQVSRRNSRKDKLVPLLAIASLIAGLWAATQYLAHVFNYHASLGVSAGKFYLPWSIFAWWRAWYELYPAWFNAAASIGTMTAAGGLIVSVLVKMIMSNSSKASEFLHGSARWANKKDIKEAGLLGNKEGVYVGAWEDSNGTLHYLRHNGPEHVLTYAPTRSGKGVGLVVPTLLSWPHSAVITDLKGELWAMTAGWRKRHGNNKVIRFEPATLEGSACWNPLDEIRIATENEVGDVQNLATLIVDPDGKGLESHWQKTAQALLVGLILHALYKHREEGIAATLPQVDNMLADPNNNIADLLTEMTQYKHVNGENHPVVGAAARDMIDRPEEEAGSILSTVKSYLSLYRDPVVAKNVSHSDFCIKDLMHHTSPVSLYIVTQPNDKARLQPLVRVMMNLIVRLLADKMEFERVPTVPRYRRLLSRFGFDKTAQTYVRTKKTYKHRLLGMIDEFPSLGKLSILQESLAFVAGYGIKFYLICQDINQLKSRETGYGPDETVTSNCHIQNAYPPNRVETADHLSKLTGLSTIVKEQISTSGKRASMLLSQVSRTMQEVQRPLLTPDECSRMPGPKKDAQGQIKEAGDMVVYVAGFPAIYGRQPLYFQDPIFTARAAVPEPMESDRLRPKTVASKEIVL